MNNLQTQYKNANHLNTRISIHDKYSVNKMGFGNWIFSHYEIAPGAQVLELGCGTGYMWKGHLDLLTGGAALMLTDFSAGMLESARANLEGEDRVSFQMADIQNIPFQDGSFDVVIANMMLYHVPDLFRGLSEVRRVLKNGGKFYCATYGEHGIAEFVTNLLREDNITDKIGTVFTLQNGAASLRQYFDNIQRFDYEDSLEVTKLEDFADYIYSLSSLRNIQDIPRNVLIKKLNDKAVNGTLHVPKEYGIFVCS